MKMIEISSPAQLEVKTDRFGRRYPYKILLRNGDQFIGLYAGSSSNDKGFEQIWFKLVEDLDEWKNNRPLNLIMKAWNMYGCHKKTQR